jgi:lipoprotein-releasing system permease protein
MSRGICNSERCYRIFETVLSEQVPTAESFTRVKSERLAIFFILTLILIIASFSIIGSLTMLIIEKERDIEILRSLGADNNYKEDFHF